MFKLWYEDATEGNALLHCTVSKWSVSVARALDLHWAALSSDLLSQGYHTAWTVSPNDRFCRYMAGTEVGAIIYNDDIYGVFKWDLK